ncbi:MAG TPA: hypothetical protein VN446_09505 [Candidatus Acidoferrum sp.]|nr:hypothetical protein [Candidatus Acidoferrum sp.]
MRKNLILTLLLVFCLAVFAACGTTPPSNDETPPSGDETPAPPDTSDEPDDPLAKALTEEQLAADDNLTKLFLDYYSEHPFELRFLPAFKDRQSLSWDGLSFYVFNLAAAEEPEYEGTVTKETFEETVSRYFGDISYEHGDSAYLTYGGGVYEPVGWDTMGTEYFRLTDISKLGDDVFRASFDGISFYDLDFSDSYNDVSPNMKAVMDELGIRTPPENAQTLRDKIADMLLDDDYDEKFEVDDRLTVTFTLADTDGQDNLFIYTSCEREDQGEGPGTTQS